MRFTHLLGATALMSTLSATAAFAQSPTPASDAQQSATQTGTMQTPTTGPVESVDPSTVTADAQGGTTSGGSDVVVTGSRIRRPNLESNMPITAIGGEEFFQQGNNNVGDTLNDLPQLRSTFAQQNPGLGIGIAGLNLLDLRGLGTARTLVLVNGRRHVGADILNNAVSPDVNTIPNDLIERVEVVTGGNSAVYGSDAIAGVVNFILRRDFDGTQVRGNAAISDRGYGGNQYVSVLSGKNFAEGRGNITAHVEYAHQERVFGSDIDFLRRADGLGVVDVDTTGLPSASDNFPDRAFFRDIRSASINLYGLIPVTQPTTNPACGVGLAPTNGAPGTTGGSPYNCTYIFTPDGRLVQQTGTRYSTGVIGGIAGGNGQTGREGQLLSVLPFQERINANILAHYSFSPAIEAFFEGKVVRVNSQGSNAGPSFIQGQLTQFDTRERIRLDNPFFNPADRVTLTNAILASGCNTSLTVTCNPTTGAGVLTAAQRAQIAAGTYRFQLARVLADSGIRDENFQRDTYRFVGGFRGTFNDDWSYELSANYGKFHERTLTSGYVDRQRFLLSLDAGVNPTTGTIQCRSQFDPASRTAFAGEDAKLASDIAACVPYNPFGAADNSAAAKYFVYNATDYATQEQFDVSGFVSGDLSQLFSLPGGPIGFAVGGEYRRENASYRQDRFILTGGTNAVVIPDFVPPTQVVKEAYGEVRVPLLKDIPFIEELSFSAAGRISRYNNVKGDIYSYNYGGEYAPFRDIRFRANYGRAVRAPNVSETGFPVVPNFATFSDPCNSGNIAANSNRATNCAADLGGLLAGLPNTTYSLPILSGSNPNLSPEKSDSLTAGVVFQPRFVPGFSLTVDYYNIRVKGVITSLSAQAIVNGCYDQPSLGNSLCNSFTRFRGPGTGPLGETPGQVLGNSLNSAPFNFAKRTRRGIDIEAAYRTTIATDVKLNTRMLYTHQLQNSNYQSTTDPNFENRLLGELGDPVDEFQFSADLTAGRFTLGYQAHYIGPMYVNTYEDFNTLQGRVPENSDYADVRQYNSVIYNDLRLDIAVGEPKSGLNFFVGVDNVFDKQPPLGTTATGAGSAIYSIRGRQFYSGFKARF